MKEREKFGSRLGFILVSAGCAIGIGNVWRFPFVVGQNGGGFFVLVYLVMLVVLGLPVLTMELAVGRASRKSAILSAFFMVEKGIFCSYPPMRSTQTDLASNSFASLSADAAAFAAAIKALSLVFAVYAYALRVPLRTRTPAPALRS